MQAKDAAVAALQRLSAFNRRSADVLSARLYSYYSLAHERLGQLEDIRRCTGMPGAAAMYNVLADPRCLSSCAACCWRCTARLTCGMT
jgi:hypothetical protein